MSSDWQIHWPIRAPLQPWRPQSSTQCYRWGLMPIWWRVWSKPSICWRVPATPPCLTWWQMCCRLKRRTGGDPSRPEVHPVCQHRRFPWALQYVVLEKLDLIITSCAEMSHMQLGDRWPYWLLHKTSCKSIPVCGKKSCNIVFHSCFVLSLVTPKHLP